MQQQTKKLLLQQFRLEEMKALRQEISWRLELQSQELHDHRQDYGTAL